MQLLLVGATLSALIMPSVWARVSQAREYSRDYNYFANLYAEDFFGDAIPLDSSEYAYRFRADIGDVLYIIVVHRKENRIDLMSRGRRWVCQDRYGWTLFENLRLGIVDQLFAKFPLESAEATS